MKNHKLYLITLVLSFILGLSACQTVREKQYTGSEGSTSLSQPPTQRACFSNLPKRNQRTRSTVFLLAAGANTGKGNKALKQTALDIKQFTRAMQQHRSLSIPKNQICQLDNVFRQEFEDALIALGNHLNPNDLAIIYFSGHGSWVSDDNGDEIDGLDETLITYDVKSKGYEDETNALKDDRFVELVNALPTDRVLTVMDTCYSGGMYQAPTDDDPLANALPKILIEGVFGTQSPNHLVKKSGTLPANRTIVNETGELDSLKGLLWASAREDELSIEIPQTGGLFTTKLIENLNRWRYKKLRTAFENTAKQVRYQTRHRETPQTPQAIGNWDVLTHP